MTILPFPRLKDTKQDPLIPKWMVSAHPPFCCYLTWEGAKSPPRLLLGQLHLVVPVPFFWINAVPPLGTSSQTLRPSPSTKSLIRRKRCTRVIRVSTFFFYGTPRGFEPSLFTKQRPRPFRFFFPREGGFPSIESWKWYFFSPARWTSCFRPSSFSERTTPSPHNAVRTLLWTGCRMF